MQQGEVGGPVRIAEISGTVLNQGIVPFILLTAVISINLGHKSLASASTGRRAFDVFHMGSDLW